MMWWLLFVTLGQITSRWYLSAGAEPQPWGWTERRGTQTNNRNHYECIDRAGLAVLLQIY